MEHGAAAAAAELGAWTGSKPSENRDTALHAIFSSTANFFTLRQPAQLTVGRAALANLCLVLASGSSTAHSECARLAKYIPLPQAVTSAAQYCSCF
jgi:hypothetical protein